MSPSHGVGWSTLALASELADTAGKLRTEARYWRNPSAEHLTTSAAQLERCREGIDTQQLEFEVAFSFLRAGLRLLDQAHTVRTRVENSAGQAHRLAHVITKEPNR